MAGELTAKYGPDGRLVEQTYPGGVVRKDTTNAVGETTSRTFTRTSENKVIWAQTTDISTQGQVAKDTTRAEEVRPGGSLPNLGGATLPRSAMRENR
ncbi:hypothetical protein, partial [Kitasatospora putterlickiae]